MRERIEEQDKAIAELRAEVARLQSIGVPSPTIASNRPNSSKATPNVDNVILIPGAPSTPPINAPPRGRRYARTNRIFDMIMAALVAVIVVEYAGVRHFLPTARLEYERQVSDAHDPTTVANRAVPTSRAPTIGTRTPTNDRTNSPTFLPPIAQPRICRRNVALLWEPSRNMLQWHS